MSFGLGCVPCTEEEAKEDETSRHVGRLIGGARASATSVDHSRHLDFVPDQGPTMSCVGNWHSSAIYLAGQAQGRPVKRPSRRWSYLVARYRANPGGPLVDAGSSVRQMCEGTERHGIVSEDRLPFEPHLINEPPPFDADLAGADALFTGFYRADANAEQLRRALELGQFPGIAIQVYQNFFDHRGGVYDDIAGAYSGGAHMLTLIAYRPGAFKVLNSWGESWGEGGFCWMSDRFIESRHCFDRYVVTAAPMSR